MAHHNFNERVFELVRHNTEWKGGTVVRFSDIQRNALANPEFTEQEVHSLAFVRETESAYECMCNDWPDEWTYGLCPVLLCDNLPKPEGYVESHETPIQLLAAAIAWPFPL